MARPLSSPLRAGTGRGATGRCAGRGAEPVAATGAAPVREAVAGAAGVGGGAGMWDAGTPADGPPGGSVGNLMVGAAEGLGGRLMRTVSFFG